jgi:hypothetical protein
MAEFRHEYEEMEEILRGFRPLGPTAGLRSRVILDEPRPARPFAMRRILLTASVLAAAASMAVFLWTNRRPLDRARSSAQTDVSSPLTADERITFERKWASQPRRDLGIESGRASVVLVEFADWLCPPCETVHVSNRSLVEKYQTTLPGAVKYVVRDWPLDTACNSSVKQTPRGHEGSCAAAAYVRVAQAHGRAEEMVDWIFANRPRISTLDATAAIETLRSGAAGILDPIDLGAAYSQELKRLRGETGPDHPVRPEFTPMVYVNGVALSEVVRPEYVDLAIQIELKNAKR